MLVALGAPGALKLLPALSSESGLAVGLNRYLRLLINLFNLPAFLF